MVLPIHSSAAKQVLWVCASIKGLKKIGWKVLTKQLVVLRLALLTSSAESDCTIWELGHKVDKLGRKTGGVWAKDCEEDAPAI